MLYIDGRQNDIIVRMGEKNANIVEQRQNMKIFGRKTINEVPTPTPCKS